MHKLKKVMWLTLFAAIATLNGCMMGGGVYASTPDICQAVPVPAHFSKRIDLEIIEGDLIRCDQGCEKLLRDYGATREALSAACSK